MQNSTLSNWPPIEGRYKIGEKTSPIAVCTLASIEEINLDLSKIAIIGSCVTENIGIERIVQNVVSNPYIRYLLLCGRESKGHFVGQALIALLENGVDKNGKIIGAKGNMPYLKGIDKKIIEIFRKKIEIIDMIGEEDEKKIEEKIDELLRKEKKGETFWLKIKKVKEIKAKPKISWIPDPKGYFIISLDPQRKKIIVEHRFKDGRLNKKIIGEKAKEICDTVVSLSLLGDFEEKIHHAMYLARELQKAEIALENNLAYIQDKKLSLLKTKDQKGESIKDEYDWYD